MPLLEAAPHPQEQQKVGDVEHLLPSPLGVLCSVSPSICHWSVKRRLYYLFPISFHISFAFCLGSHFYILHFSHFAVSLHCIVFFVDLSMRRYGNEIKL